ncbi:MAG: septal ring lytic transglycosylase RlpA family protein [Filomicrobium sp.]
MRTITQIRTILGPGNEDEKRRLHILSLAAITTVTVLISACSMVPEPPTPAEPWQTSVLRATPDQNQGNRSHLLASPIPPSRTLKPKPAASVFKPTARIPKGGGYRKLGKPYTIKGIRYVPRHEPNYVETGDASWYGDDFHGKKTANGETYDMTALTAAHRTLPLPSYASVKNLENGRKVMVRLNDRGPFKKNRIIDVSHRVAKELGFVNDGTARVEVRYLGPAPLDGNDAREQAFLSRKQN